MSEQSIENKSLTKKFYIEDILGLYFRPKSFETKNNERLYRYLGVRLFKKILPTGGDYVNRFIVKNPGWSLEALIKDNNNDIDFSARAYYFFTCGYETLHLGLLGWGLSNIFENISNRDYHKLTQEIVYNLLVNVYPIMLQRYNRSRISKVISRIDERKESERPHPRTLEDIDKEIEELRLETSKYLKSS